MENENYYKDLDPILDEVNEQYIRMDGYKKKKFVNLTLEVVDQVINKMKENDVVFNKLYSRLVYVGSYFDGLRVKDPTEFDINLIMKMPFDYNKILVENDNVPAGFVKINVSNAKNYIHQPVVTRTIDNWIDSNGYMLENKVREWMEGTIVRSLGSGNILLTVSSGQVTVSFRKSGPAFTLKIYTSSTIDVDLVFTIEFPETKSPPGSMRWTKELAAPWVVVPKPSVDSRFWRASFTCSERKLIHQQYKLKFINRLLKAFRDAQTNIGIPSYFIKNLFLWEAHKCIYNNSSQFLEKQQGYLFVYMLNELYEALVNKRLAYYWHKNMNLFGTYPSSRMINMANQIDHIISEINDLIKRKDTVTLKKFVLSIFIPRS